MVLEGTDQGHGRVSSHASTIYGIVPSPHQLLMGDTYNNNIIFIIILEMALGLPSSLSTVKSSSLVDLTNSHHILASPFISDDPNFESY